MNYEDMPIAEVNNLIKERIQQIKDTKIFMGELGPLHPRTMLYVLDTLLGLART